jgi:hypothetical protein
MYGTLYRVRVPVPCHSTLRIFCSILEISYMKKEHIQKPRAYGTIKDDILQKDFDSYFASGLHVDWNRFAQVC